MSGITIRLTDAGTLDELLADGASVHLERMDSGHWWLCITKDGKSVHVSLHAARAIKATYRKERADAG